jgi:hypothetical protein
VDTDDEVLNPNPNSWSASGGDVRHWGRNQVGGIHLGDNNSRIVIQRNVIRAPHFGSFPWDTHVPGFNVACPETGGEGDPRPNNHPVGPNGISVYHGGQQNVIRYNEISGHPTDQKKWLNDGIGGERNFSAEGSPGADSDIYQNIVMQAFDDAIESEGAGRNVRIWGNYITDALVAVAATVVHHGPHYAWRNVANRLRKCYQQQTNTDFDRPSAAGFKYTGLKPRSSANWGDGLRLVFNNTLLQQPGGTRDEGAANGISGFGNGTNAVRYTIARNNILHVRSSTSDGLFQSLFSGNQNGNEPPPGSEFTHNLFNGGYGTQYLAAPSTRDPAYEFGGPGQPQLAYKSGHGWSSEPLGGSGTGNYQLTDGGFGRSMGTHVPNFTKDIDDEASAKRSGFHPVQGNPDPGAHQNGAVGSMRFGISAGQ